MWLCNFNFVDGFYSLINNSNFRQLTNNFMWIEFFLSLGAIDDDRHPCC